jgi:hypothetical protein
MIRIIEIGDIFRASLAGRHGLNRTTKSFLT